MEGTKVTAYDIFCELEKSESKWKNIFYAVFKKYLEGLNPPINITAADFEYNKIGVLGCIWNGDLYGLSINGKNVYIEDVVR